MNITATIRQYNVSNLDIYNRPIYYVYKKDSYIDGNDSILGNDPARNSIQFNRLLNNIYNAGGGSIICDNKLTLFSDTIIYRSNSSVRINMKDANFKLADGANKDLLRSWDFDNQAGSNNSSVGMSFFIWDNVILNGNRQNNTLGTTFKRYGFAGKFLNCEFLNGAEDNIDSEWAVGAEATAPSQTHNGMEDIWVSCRSYNAGNRNYWWKGPHDSIMIAPIGFADGNVETTTQSNLVLSASSTYASGPLFLVGGHFWGITQNHSIITETSDPNNSAKLVGDFDVEGALTDGKYAIYMNTGGNKCKAHAYYSKNGIYINGNHQDIDCKVSAIEGGVCVNINSSSASRLAFNIEAGTATTSVLFGSNSDNIVDIVSYQSTGSDYFGGTINNINNNSQNNIIMSGLANRVTINTMGDTFRVRDNKVTIVGNAGEQMKVYSTAKNADIVNVNATNDPAYQFVNETKLEGFQGNYSNLTWRISTWDGKATFRTLNISNIPTSAAGLSIGDVYRTSGGNLQIVH